MHTAHCFLWFTLPFETIVGSMSRVPVTFKSEDVLEAVGTLDPDVNSDDEKMISRSKDEAKQRQMEFNDDIVEQFEVVKLRLRALKNELRKGSQNEKEAAEAKARAAPPAAPPKRSAPSVTRRLVADEDQAADLKQDISLLRERIAKIDASESVRDPAIEHDLATLHRHILLLQSGVAEELVVRVEAARRVIQKNSERRKQQVTSASLGSPMPKESASASSSFDYVENLTLAEKDKLRNMCRILTTEIQPQAEIIAHHIRRMDSLRELHAAAIAQFTDAEEVVNSLPYVQSGCTALEENCSEMQSLIDENAKAVEQNLAHLRTRLAAI